jgi:O-antigen ligase
LIGLFYTLNNNLTFDGRLRAFYESPNYLAMYLAPGFLFAIYLFIFRKDLWNYADNAENNNYKIESRKSINPSIFHSAAERRNPFITIKRALHRLNVAKGFFGLPQNDKNNKLLQETSSFSSNIKFLSMVELQKIQIIILLVFAIALFLTKSYGTFSGIVVALVLLLFRNYKDKKIFIDKNAKKNIHVFSVIILLLFSFVSYQKYQQIINSNERSSLHSRLMIWNSSFEMLKDSPVFGIGPGTFQQVYLDYQSHFSVPYLEWAVAEPHNTFLAFYLESGFVGFVGFILILFWFYKRSKTNDIIFLFLIYFLIHGLVDTLYWKNDLAMVFWMMVAAGVIFKINNLQSK